MEFKTQYPEGDWTTEKTLFDARDMIYDGHGNVVCRSGMNSYASVYTKVILQIPVMLDYMIERAKHLREITSGPDDGQFNDWTKRKKSELKRILSILRDAGVEVME